MQLNVLYLHQALPFAVPVKTTNDITMKKRLRKKLHKGEFQELGFNVDFHYNAADENEACELIDEFLAETEKICLCVGGWYGHDGNEASFFVVSYENRSVTPAERENLVKWLENNPKISNVVAGELRDAWYGW